MQKENTSTILEIGKSLRSWYVNISANFFLQIPYHEVTESVITTVNLIHNIKGKVYSTDNILHRT